MLNTNDTPAGPAAPRDRSAPNANPNAAAAGNPGDAPPQRFTELGAKRFLDELAETGSVSEAARRARLPRATLYRRRADDPDFAKSWDEALEMAYDLLHDEAMRRAIEGVEQPVFYRGEQVGTVRRHSDRLLMFLMRAHRPERYDPSYIPPYAPSEEEIAEREAARERTRKALNVLRAEREAEFYDAMPDEPRRARRRKAKGGTTKRGGSTARAKPASGAQKKPSPGGEGGRRKPAG